MEGGKRPQFRRKVEADDEEDDVVLSSSVITLKKSNTSQTKKIVVKAPAVTISHYDDGEDGAPAVFQAKKKAVVTSAQGPQTFVKRDVTAKKELVAPVWQAAGEYTQEKLHSLKNRYSLIHNIRVIIYIYIYNNVLYLYIIVNFCCFILY